jgi:radical SAM superfamily enzyme YgiQ (UPF0313 family)
MENLFLSPPRPQITDLDRLPIPNRSLVDYEKYNRYIGQASIKNSMALQATRGCPYRCAYCHKIWPRKHQVRSAENVLEEVLLYYELGIRRIEIHDDVFNFDIDNSRRFLELVIKHKLDIKLFFETGLRGDRLTKDYIDLLVRAGTTGATLALETASPRLQKLIGKHINLPKLKENLDYITETYPHIILGLQTMIGFPSETEEEASMTLDFIKSIKWLHFAYVHILKVFPNTDMEKLALEHGVSREAIAKTRDQAYHEISETLPFDKSFTFQYQTDFLHRYVLNKDRLRHILPHQLNELTEDELVQKYNSFLPIKADNFPGLLERLGMGRDETGGGELLEKNYMAVPNLNLKLARVFPPHRHKPDALRVMLLDLTQYFSGETDMLYDVVEPPLGLMMLLSYLYQELGEQVTGRIAKSRIDFDSFDLLRAMLDEFKPDVIGIRTLTFYKDFFNQAAAKIRQWGYNIPIISGGPHATSDYGSIFKDTGVDVVVTGEGELTFCELIGKIIQNQGHLPPEQELKEIKGIVFIPGGTVEDRDKKKLDALTDDLEDEF